MRAFYSILVFLGTPLLLLYFFVRGARDRAYRQRWPERFGSVPSQCQPGGILIHAASVGEVNAGKFLIQSLLEALPGVDVTVSTLTPTGSDQVRRELGGKVSSCYIPIDNPWFVKRFLKHLRPRLIIIIETEIWPNLYFHAQRRGIPLMMANARLSERSLNRYRFASEFIAQTLGRVSWVGAQSAGDQRRLVECGAEADIVRMTGNLKFDLNVSTNTRDKATALRTQWGQSRPVLVAGSTHEDDENVVIPAFGRILRNIPDALLILVPRHPERFTRAAQLARAEGLQTELHSQGEVCSPRAQCFLIDTIGELMTYYACGDLAFVGGSIGDQGGHNALEPAALGLPVLLGPNMDNAQEIADKLLECQAASRVRDPDGFAAIAEEILTDASLRNRMGRAGKELVETNRGALDISLKAATRLFQNPV